MESKPENSKIIKIIIIGNRYDMQDAMGSMWPDDYMWDFTAPEEAHYNINLYVEHTEITGKYEVVKNWDKKWFWQCEFTAKPEKIKYRLGMHKNVYLKKGESFFDSKVKE